MIYWLFLIVLFLNIKLYIENKANKTKIKIGVFGIKISLPMMSKNKDFSSIKKALEKAVVWKNAFFQLLKKSFVRNFDVKCSYCITGEIYENYLYVFTMTTINTIYNYLLLNTKGIKEKNFNNIIASKYNIDFYCVLQIRLYNVLFIGIKTMLKFGGKKDESSS